ncbi:MAG: hypothetical protein AAGE94_14470 [Acidobacteriota bacterium]
MTDTTSRSFFSITFACLVALLSASCAAADGNLAPGGGNDEPDRPAMYAALWRDIPGPTLLDRATTIAGFEGRRATHVGWQLVDLEVGGTPGKDRELAGIWRSADTQGESEHVYYDLERWPGGNGGELVNPSNNLFSDAFLLERAAGYELVDLEISKNGQWISGVWHAGTDLHTPLFDLTWPQLLVQFDIRKVSQTLVDIEVYYAADGSPLFATLWADRVTYGTEIHRFDAFAFHDQSPVLFGQVLRPIDLETYVEFPQDGGDGGDWLAPGLRSNDQRSDNSADETPVTWAVGIWSTGVGEDWWTHKRTWDTIITRDGELTSRPLVDGGPLSMLDLDLVHMGGDGSVAEPMPLDHDGTTGDADL